MLGLERLNTEVDIRHKPRALSAEEVGKLVASARESGVSIQRFSGEKRARIYILSFMTGARSKARIPDDSCGSQRRVSGPVAGCRLESRPATSGETNLEWRQEVATKASAAQPR